MTRSATAVDRGRGAPRAPAVALAGRRRWAGLALAVVALPTLTVALVAARGSMGLASVLLLFLLVVVVVAAVGGVLVGLATAAAAFALANYFLTPPFHTFVVESRDSVIALSVFVAVATIVSVVVDAAARQRAEAARSELEAEALGRVAVEPLAGRTSESLLRELAETFGLTSAELREIGDGARVLARYGAAVADVTVRVDAGPGREVVGEGPVAFAADRRVLRGMAHAAARAAEAEALADEAARARELAEVDRLRAALLAAVGHDLRTPLATTKAAVTALRLGNALTEPERGELLGAIEGSTDRLTGLVSDLLDLSRLQSGAVVVAAEPVAPDEVVARALIEHHVSAVANDVPDDLPFVVADAALLERVLANLVGNARAHAAASEVRVVGRRRGAMVDIEVSDHGPGVAEADWARMFLPFQRLDDHAPGQHTGLGLAIAKGFTEVMGGSLTPSTTPGGGLTMTVTLPVAGSAGSAVETPRASR
ncbi:MAG TPA: ATP-binding protein [Angustibacter sp.]|nr:ATP-binding protein [Angustibacter sp.]